LVQVVRVVVAVGLIPFLILLLPLVAVVAGTMVPVVPMEKTEDQAVELPIKMLLLELSGKELPDKGTTVVLELE
jgi:hypothetical protein